MAMSGTYTLIVMDAMGCLDTATTAITVNNRPSVNATGTDCCFHDTLSLHGSGPVVSYDWTGPAGFTSALMDPIIPNATLANTGWYHFTGTASNGCSGVCSVYVEIIYCCARAIAKILCPDPCWQFSSCSSQVIIFGIKDTSGIGIDTMQVHFTEQVFPNIGSPTITYIHEPSGWLYFTGDLVGLDSLRAIISGTWADGDSVSITLDSIFTTDSCKAFP
jgi:hypothetical protein